MIATIIMSVGVLLVIIGAVLFGKSKKKIDINNINTIIEEDTFEGTMTNEQVFKVTTDINSLNVEKIIEIAIADGVLTNNEKKKLREVADNNNLNYDSIIQRAEAELKTQNIKSETELINYNYKNGLDFEKYIVQRFDKSYFSIKNWAGDKYIDGHYAETTPQPDILFEFKSKNEKAEFAVECKWRKDFFKNGIEFANKEQFERYKNFEKSTEIPVFIAIGVGGEGSKPKNVYVVPLRALKSNFIHIDYLKNFEKVDDKNFYFVVKTKILK